MIPKLKDLSLHANELVRAFARSVGHARVCVPEDLLCCWIRKLGLLLPIEYKLYFVSLEVCLLLQKKASFEHLPWEITQLVVLQRNVNLSIRKS